MRYRDCMIAWTPASDSWEWKEDAPPGSIRVGAHPDKDGWSDAYAYTGGSCFLVAKRWPIVRCILQVQLDFNTCVVRDRIPVDQAHEQFLKIDEYRFHISPDSVGATDWSDDYSEEYWKEMGKILKPSALRAWKEQRLPDC